MPVDDALIESAAEALGVEVVAPLKQGGQKTVLLVRSGAVTHVMKVIAIGVSNPDAFRRAERETDLLLGVNHPNLVRLTSELVELGDPCIGVAWLEQHLDGEDLGELVSSPWSWDDTRRMAIDISRGLGALHGVKVVHRDLSANNIRRVTDGHFVVMDPGYARHHKRSELTVGGQPGTIGFMSPEHLQSYSGAPTPASDVFCVGILSFLVLTGRLPIEFTGDIADYAARLLAVEVPDIATLRTDLPVDAVSIVNRCLHPQPARRYRNGTRLAEALESLP